MKLIRRAIKKLRKIYTKKFVRNLIRKYCKRYHLVYVMTFFLPSGTYIYVGRLSTDNDPYSYKSKAFWYFGSGKRPVNICRKYKKRFLWSNGMVNKEVLVCYDSREEPFALGKVKRIEKQIVTPEFIARPDVLNMATPNGLGGFGIPKEDLIANNKKMWQKKGFREKIRKTREERGIQIRKETVEEIYNLCWGADRGTQLYRLIAKQYNLPFGTVEGIALGRHLDDKVHAKNIQEWNNKYAIIIKVTTPGRDRLEEFDQTFASKQLIPPSIRYKIISENLDAYQARKLLEDKGIKLKWVTIQGYCAKPTRKGKIQKKKAVAKTPNWYTEEMSKTYEFTDYHRLAEWIQKTFGIKCDRGKAHYFVRKGDIKQYQLRGYKFEVFYKNGQIKPKRNEIEKRRNINI